ncbi:MAG: HAD family hydrolase [Bacteroidia bacterium]|nr:HAD family hydrolase [Bacteroidia bacterium]
MNSFKIDKSWTLFLDRDGVINKRLIDDYVKSWDEFEFLPGTINAIADFSQWFGVIVVVTNQQGIGKGLMTVDDLQSIHNQMVESIEQGQGRIDGIYFCPDLKHTNPVCRKPQPGMGYQAKEDFPEIDFSKSIMVGDSLSDMEFGRKLGMKNVFISSEINIHDDNLTDITTTNLDSLASILRENMT